MIAWYPQSVTDLTRSLPHHRPETD